MSILKNICLYLVLGAVINSLCNWLKSDYLSTFLHTQIITLSITLVAITSAVRGIILGKVTELNLANEELDFTLTFKELKIAVYEQIVMILISIVALVILNSKIPQVSLLGTKFGVDSVLIAILLFNIYILYDIGVATIDIFIAINSKNKS